MSSSQSTFHDHDGELEIGVAHEKQGSSTWVSVTVEAVYGEGYHEAEITVFDKSSEKFLRELHEQSGKLLGEPRLNERYALAELVSVAEEYLAACDEERLPNIGNERDRWYQLSATVADAREVVNQKVGV